MANPEHVAVVREGKETIEGWRRVHPNTRFDLREADLTKGDFTDCNLSGA